MFVVDIFVCVYYLYLVIKFVYIYLYACIHLTRTRRISSKLRSINGRQLLCVLVEGFFFFISGSRLRYIEILDQYYAY